MVLSRGFLFNMIIHPQFYNLYRKKSGVRLLFLIYILENALNIPSKKSGIKLVYNKFPFWWYTFDPSISNSSLQSELSTRYPDLTPQNLNEIDQEYQKFKNQNSNLNNLQIEHTIDLNTQVFRISSATYDIDRRLVLSYAPKEIHPRQLWTHLPDKKLKDDNKDLDYLGFFNGLGKIVFVEEWNKIIP
jgi:hypothetical protein